MPPTRPMTRRPQTPEESEREILQAAHDLLRRRPFHELSVDAIMANTGLKRPSFYVHFRDRHDVVLRVLATVGEELLVMSERWFRDESDPVESARTALEGIVDVWVRDGPVLKALADAAADDPDVDTVYHAMVERFIDGATQHILREQQAGRALSVDAAQMSRALVWLNERYLCEMLGREPQGDRQEIVNTLYQIWVRSIYGDDPI